MSCEYCDKRPSMTPNQYQMLAARTMNHNLSAKEQEKHALYGMAGELGELHGLYQKVYQGHEFDTEHAKKELGDLLFACVNIGRKAGCDCEKALKESTDRFAARFTLAEKKALADGRDVTKLTETEWDGYYRAAKAELCKA